MTKKELGVMAQTLNEIGAEIGVPNLFRLWVRRALAYGGGILKTGRVHVGTLLGSFHWEGAHEGHDFWSDVNRGFQPKIRAHGK